MKGVEFLRSLPYVDADRIGVHGWRFGGHMNTARCLLSMDRREEARPHLEYVAEQGNRLYLRREAQQALAELA